LEGSDRTHFIFLPLEGILLIEFRENVLWAVRLCGVGYMSIIKMQLRQSRCADFVMLQSNTFALYLLFGSGFSCFLIQMLIKTSKINIRHDPQ